MARILAALADGIEDLRRDLRDVATGEAETVEDIARLLGPDAPKLPR